MRSLTYNTAIATCRTQQHDPNLGYARCLMPNCRQEATDPHHWLFPQGNNVDLVVQDDPRNIGLLCKKHHKMAHDSGQLEATNLACYRFKARIYDLQNWLVSLLGQGLIKVKPRIPQARTLDELWQLYIFLKDVREAVPDLQLPALNSAVSICEYILNIIDPNELPILVDARYLKNVNGINTYDWWST